MTCLLRNSGSLRPCRGAAGLQVGCFHPDRVQHAVLNSSQRAEKRSRGVAPVVPVARWEDEGRRRRRGSAHLVSAAEDLKPRCCCCCWTPELKSVEASMMFLSDGTLSAVTHALLLGITCLSLLCDLTKGSADFSGLELVFYRHKQLEYHFQSDK